MTIHHYNIVGRKLPTETDPDPQIYRMRIFASNSVRAKSRFWYFLHQLNKLKRSTGEILAVNEIREASTRTVKNYGITIKYTSRSGIHNMFREYRDVSLTRAVEQMYQDMAGRHRARFSSIQIVDTCVIPAGVRAMKKFNPTSPDEKEPKHVRSANLQQFLTSKIKFPLVNRKLRPARKAFRTTFSAKRPSTFFS